MHRMLEIVHQDSIHGRTKAIEKIDILFSTTYKICKIDLKGSSIHDKERSLLYFDRLLEEESTTFRKRRFEIRFRRLKNSKDGYSQK